jgi:hypothetical protein
VGGILGAMKPSPAMFSCMQCLKLYKRMTSCCSCGRRPHMPALSPPSSAGAAACCGSARRAVIQAWQRAWCQESPPA